MSNPLLQLVAKKTPEQSKVTKMMTAQGWTLVGGNEVWLTFKKKGVPGEVTVTRGTKEWTYDLPTVQLGDDPTAEGKGLDSLQAALPQFTPKAHGMSAGAASIAVNNAANGANHVDEDIRIATDHQGHAQMEDAPKVLAFLQNHGAALPQEVAVEFGWSHEQAYGMLNFLRSEGKVGIKQMRYYPKQANRFRFRSKILYRKSKPINVFQLENKQIKEGGPQGDDISRKSLGDYPRMRRSR